MARQDIQIDTLNGEAAFTDNLADKKIYPFSYLGEMPGMDAERHGYGEIAVPAGFENRYRPEDGIRVRMPYLPEHKELKVRFRQEHAGGGVSYLRNRRDNTVWFPVMAPGESVIRLCAFRTVNGKGCYNLVLSDGILYLYSGHETDFVIKPSLEQTKAFLLKASAGNLYQYPTTGVGLTSYLHGNFENSDLASKLLQEFEADGIVVKNASMDSSTGELLLEAEEKTNRWEHTK